jgi:hypothetical protein
MGDMRVLDPDQNPTLLQSLRNDVIMIGLNISRPFSEPFRNFHDASGKAHDYKLRYAFAGTEYYGAYMTDFIKGVVILNSKHLLLKLRGNPSLVRENVERLLAEFDDLHCERPLIFAFGTEAFRLVTNNLPPDRYSRVIPLQHYSRYVSKEEYRQRVLGEVGVS